MIRCDTKEERKALTDLTWAVYEAVNANQAERRRARERLSIAYDEFADIVVGMKKVSGSERYPYGR